MQGLRWREFTGQVVEGKYHLADFIAAGSFGGVFRADEVVGDRLMRTVAVKLLSPPQVGSEDERRRIQITQLDELQLSARVDHPNIIRCYSIGQCELSGQQLLYVVMELGEYTLEHRIAQQALGADELRELAFELAIALDYLHGLPGGMVHRDLKPGNVLRVRESWKLSDLGTARHLGGQEVLTGDAIGTAEYAPPESYSGIISPAWDIWSLGVIIVEAYSTRLPFSGTTLEELRAAVAGREPDIPGELPEVFRRITEGCLQRQRERRPSPRQILSMLRETVNLSSPASAPRSGLRQSASLPTGLGTPAGFSSPAPARPAPLPPAAPPHAAPAAAAPLPAHEPVAAADKAGRRDTDAQQLLRNAIIQALEDEVVTSEEKRELNSLRKQLSISLEEAARLFAEIKANPRRPSDAPPATRRPEPVAPLTSAVIAPTGTAAGRTPPPQSAVPLRSSPVPAEPALRRMQLIVDPQGKEPGSVATIAEAMQRVSEGARILLRPGVYRESVVIGKRIELIGMAQGGESVMIESLDRHAMIMQASQAVVRGITLNCRNTRPGGQACALTVPGGELLMEDCRLLADAASAVTIFGAEANPTLRHCVIECSGDVGISMTHGARGAVIDSKISGGRVAGVFIADGAEPVLRRCEIHSNQQHGILVYKGAGGTIEHCSIHDHGIAGVALKGSGNVIFRHCRITQNQQYGLIATLGAAGGVTDCDLSRNRRGAMSIEPGCRLLLRGNAS